MNYEIRTLVIHVAGQYLNQNSDQYRHANVCLPLDITILTLAIEAQIVGSFLTQFGGEIGRSNALKFLAAMFNEGTLNDRGTEVIDSMLRTFCESMRSILDAGLDPTEVLGGCVGRHQ